MTIKELMQVVVNKSFEERVELAKKSVSEMVNGFIDDYGLDEEQVTTLIVNIVVLFLSADKKLTEDEYKMVIAVLGANVSFEELNDLVTDNKGEEFEKDVDELIDSLNTELKTSVCFFGLCILAADDTISVAEQKLFNRILD